MFIHPWRRRLDGSSAPDGIVHKDNRIKIKRPDGLIGGWSGGWLWFKSISSRFEYWMIDGGHVSYNAQVRPDSPLTFPYLCPAQWPFHKKWFEAKLKERNTLHRHLSSLSLQFNAGGRKVNRKRREKDRSNPSSLTGVVFFKCTWFAWSRYYCRKNVPLSSASVKLTKRTNSCYLATVFNVTLWYCGSFTIICIIIWYTFHMELLQFIEKFQEVKEATKNISGTSPGKTSTSTANGSTSATVAAPTSMTNSTSASANASPVNSRSAMANAGLGSGATPSAFTNDDKEPAKQECECSALASGRSAPKSFFPPPLSTFRSDALASWTRDFRPINERQGRSPSFSLSLQSLCQLDCFLLSLPCP